VSGGRRWGVGYLIAVRRAPFPGMPCRSVSSGLRPYSFYVDMNLQ
jgi:hypothetical protein